MIQLTQHKAKHLLANDNSLLKSIKFLVLKNLAQWTPLAALGRWEMLDLLGGCSVSISAQHQSWGWVAGWRVGWKNSVNN